MEINRNDRIPTFSELIDAYNKDPRFYDGFRIGYACGSNDAIDQFSDLDRCETRSVLGLDDRDVGARVVAYDRCLVLIAFDGDDQGVSIRDHVIIRDDIAILREHDTATERGLR